VATEGDRPQADQPKREQRTALLSAVAVFAVLLLAVGGAIWMTSDVPSDREAPESAEAAADHRPLLIHLGDSYASGAGTTPLVEDSPFQCQRSSRNFGQLTAKKRDLRVLDVTCAGATSDDFYQEQYDGVAPQLDAVTEAADYVTLTIGGNDSAIYTVMVGECTRLAADDPTGAPCRTTVGGTPFRQIAETRKSVERALRDIRARAPHAGILIAGYPWLMPATTACRPAVGVADGDVAYVHRVQAALNDAIAEAAAAAGATFVDMSTRSVGHEACAPRGTRWIEPQIGADSPIVMHPNALGQQAIADAVAGHLR